MKKFLLFKTITFLCLLFSSILHAQWQNGLWTEKQAYNWCFGDYVGLEFNSGSPLPFPNVQGNGSEGSTVMSDSNGQLLFYAFGGTNPFNNEYYTTVWNKNHEIMANGTDILGDGMSSSQFGVIVPKPNNPNIYYLFATSQFYGLRYSEIDMTLDEGNGAVTENKNILLNETKIEKITAVYHVNGKHIWVISHATGSNEFLAYLITETGISGPVISGVGLSYPAFGGGVWTPYLDYAVGSLKASPDGTKLTETIMGLLGPDRGVQVLDFNNETGEVSNQMFLEDFFNPVFGVEFSPNNRFLYVAEYVNFSSPDTRIIQFDLNAGDENAIQSTATVIGSFIAPVDEYLMSGGMQLGPDGKIYAIAPNVMSNVGEDATTMNVINYPNNAGIDSGLEEYTVDLGGKTSNVALPTFIQSYFESGILYEGSNCFGEEISFSTIRIPGITAITWDFGDPDSGAANTSTIIGATHIFSSPGMYTVTATITSNGAIQMSTTEVVIIEGPKAVAPATELLVKCADENGTTIFDLSAFNTTILEGQDANVFSLAYYATEADRLTDNPIADLSNFTTVGQTIYAVVTSSETGCRTILPLTFIVNPLPVVAVPTPIEQCGDLAGNSVFNLRNQDAVILNGQNAADFTIVYYTDEAMENTIGQPETFTSAGQTIYVEITNLETSCSSNVSFNVAVTEVDLIGAELSVEGCSPFNLTTILTQIPIGVTVSFYPTEQDALNETNAIADPKEYVVSETNAVVYVVAKTAEGCISISELKLQSAGCVIPRGISPNGDGLNDRFDLSSFDVKTLKIFNRYGKEVYTKDNYTNQFFGQGTHGHDLPTGTYYYMIQLGSGEQKTGWVYLNLEVKQ